MKTSRLVAQFFAALPLGCVLMPDQVERHLRAAVRQYSAYADLECGVEIDEQARAEEGSEQDLDLSHSELGIIRPLWDLYIEKENATGLEASRTQGADPWGRPAADVQVGIENYERLLPLLAFASDIVSI